MAHHSLQDMIRSSAASYEEEQAVFEARVPSPKNRIASPRRPLHDMPAGGAAGHIKPALSFARGSARASEAPSGSPDPWKSLHVDVSVQLQ